MIKVNRAAVAASCNRVKQLYHAHAIMVNVVMGGLLAAAAAYMVCYPESTQ